MKLDKKILFWIIVLILALPLLPFIIGIAVVIALYNEPKTRYRIEKSK